MKVQKKNRGLGLTWLATVALMTTSFPGHATSVRQMNVVDLLAHSGDIVAGQVEKVTDGFDDMGIPYTEVTLKVTDTIRGARNATYTFRQFGLEKPRKLADGSVYLGRPQGWPTWRKDESAILFMYPKARRTGLQTTVGLGYGKVSVGNGSAMNGFDNVGLFTNVRVSRGLLDAQEQQMFTTSEGPVDSEAFRKFLHRAVEGNWVKNGSIANAKR